ncbi:MAG TPA: phosphoserine phosphatase SerB [Hyphomicrobiaceae bacterium]|nr:phosphoserine phosphatase SerB [Hyphomicrobiaceae bacterium]
MRFVVVVTGAPPGGEETEERIRALVAGEPRLDIAAARWLAPKEACELDIELAGSAARGFVDRLQPFAESARLDIAIVPAAGRRKALLISDMDSTIIGQECIDEMADVVGRKREVAAVTERAMRGELPFEAALEARLALLKGVTTVDLERVFERRISLMPGARTLVQTMRANGAYTALVSGGFTFFTSRVAKAVGFDMHRANTLELAGETMTGRVVQPILGREAKREMLEGLVSARGIAPAATLAVGDGANDLAMIRQAGLGVAFRAKPIVAAEAHAAIRHGDLTALLYLQGYARSEFATV